MTAQLDLSFNGPTMEPDIDGPRISRALDLVLDALQSGGWWTITGLARYAKCSEAGASARLRDLRKAQHGSHVVGRRRTSPKSGLWEYKLMDPTPDHPRAA